MCTVYTKLYIITHKLTKRTPSTHMSAITKIGVQTTLLGGAKSTPFNAVPAALLRNIKAAKRIGLLFCICLICWCVYVVMVAVNYMCMCHPREVTWLANIINYSSTALNPLVYGLLTKNIRDGVVKVFCRNPLFTRSPMESSYELKSFQKTKSMSNKWSSSNSTQLSDKVVQIGKCSQRIVFIL